MSKLLCILLSALIIGVGNAQVQIRTGEDFNEKMAYGDFIGAHEGKLYSFTNGLRKRIINVYSSDNLNLLQQFDIPKAEYNGKEISVYTLTLLEGQFVVFYNYYDKDTDSRKLLMQNMTLKGEMIGSIKELSDISAVSKSNSGSFQITYHKEEKAVSFISFPPFEKYANEKLTFSVFDESMQIIWKDEVELPFLDRFFTVSSYVLDSDKNIWAMCSFNEFRATKEEKGRRQAKSEMKERGGYYTYSLVKYDHTQKSIKEIKLELDGGNKIVAFNYILTDEGKLYVVGSYGDEVSKGNAIGIFFLQIDAASGKVEKTGLEPLDKALIATLAGEKNADKGKGVGSFVFRDFLSKEGGGLTVVGEIYYTYTVCTTDPRTGATSCANHYVFGAIVVLDIASDGSIQWTTPIPKHQHSVNDGGFISGYLMLEKKDELIFLYNDSPKNFAAKKKANKTYPMPSAMKAITAIATVSSDGKMRTKQSTKLNEIRMVLCPRYTYKLEENGKVRLFAYAVRKKQRLAEITLE